MNATITAVLAVAGLAVGAMLPRVIAAIPDRTPVTETDEPPATPPTPYRELAAGRRLPYVLAVVTAVVWAVVTVAADWSVPEAAAYLVVAALGVAMAFVDLREHRLPDWLTLPALAAGAVGLGVAAMSQGEWGAYGRAWLGAAAVGAFYLVLALLRPADLGFGDVKLALVIGLMLGWLGWSTVVTGVFLGFLLGGLAGVVLLAAGRAGRRTAIPFGPFMLAGALAAIVWGQWLVDAYLGR